MVRSGRADRLRVRRRRYSTAFLSSAVVRMIGVRGRSRVKSRLTQLSEATLESALKFTRCDSKKAEALLECLTFPQILEQDCRVRAEPADQNIGGDEALFVSDRGFCRAKTAEAALQIGQGNRHSHRLEAARRERRIAWLEIARQALLEPARHAPVRHAAHHRMGQLVRKHMIELRQVLRGALDRNADAAVEEAV